MKARDKLIRMVSSSSCTPDEKKNIVGCLYDVLGEEIADQDELFNVEVGELENTIADLRKKCEKLDEQCKRLSFELSEIKEVFSGNK